MPKEKKACDRIPSYRLHVSTTCKWALSLVFPSIRCSQEQISWVCVSAWYAVWSVTNRMLSVVRVNVRHTHPLRYQSPLSRLSLIHPLFLPTHPSHPSFLPQALPFICLSSADFPTSISPPPSLSPLHLSLSLCLLSLSFPPLSPQPCLYLLLSLCCLLYHSHHSFTPLSLTLPILHHIPLSILFVILFSLSHSSFLFPSLTSVYTFISPSLSFTSPLPHPLHITPHLFYVPLWTCPSPSLLPPSALSSCSLINLNPPFVSLAPSFHMFTAGNFYTVKYVDTGSTSQCNSSL